MTDNIVEFPGQTEQHLCGNAICAGCKHEWEATAPVGTVHLECPECGTMKGTFKFPTAPIDEGVYTCNHCEGQLFFLQADGVMCTLCGFKHDYQEVFDVMSD